MDLRAGVVRLDVGTTKNKEGRSFYLTAELRDLLTAQLDAPDELKRAGKIFPFVFHRPNGKTEAIYRRYAIVDEQMHREAAAKLDAWADQQRAASGKPSVKVG